MQEAEGRAAGHAALEQVKTKPVYFDGTRPSDLTSERRSAHARRRPPLVKACDTDNGAGPLWQKHVGQMERTAARLGLRL
jgi:hypothetical protein